jgi:hypothetical protein
VKSWLTIACIDLLNRKAVDNPLAARDHNWHLMGATSQISEVH